MLSCAQGSCECENASSVIADTAQMVISTETLKITNRLPLLSASTFNASQPWGLFCFVCLFVSTGVGCDLE